jgi:hypothetical protein
MNTPSRWSTERANEWYARQPWLVGCNFIPSNAINQLEMWQPETFDTAAIDRELGWAAAIGFNTVRTFLHDLAWEADPEGFIKRLDCFLDIASRHGIRPMLVFFDDCWNGDPKLGPQPAPKPGIHNSGWLQSPGIDVVNRGSSNWGRLETYVQDILTSFSEDDRILFWDLYNEPGNSKNGEKSLPLVKAVFEWARAVDPSQPLTVGLWSNFPKLNRFQIEASDIITFHHYWPAEKLKRQITKLKQYGRPVICTEWMARSCGSLVSTNLPVFALEKVGCINWGLVAGKTNTIYQWQELNPVKGEFDLHVPPGLWFHDLFRPDGTPYDVSEIETFRKYTGFRQVSTTRVSFSDIIRSSEEVM